MAKYADNLSLSDQTQELLFALQNDFYDYLRGSYPTIPNETEVHAPTPLPWDRLPVDLQAIPPLHEYGLPCLLLFQDVLFGPPDKTR